MSNIEPTEEQKQAANAFVLKTRIAEEDSFASSGLARLLAEREAKLEEHIKWLEMQCVSFEDANINNQKTIKARNIEPTEEQRADARAWQDGVEQRVSGHPTLALLLAEREAKLREEVAELSKGWRADEDEIDRLRARVAELEAELAEVKADFAAERERVDEWKRAAARTSSLNFAHKKYLEEEEDRNTRLKVDLKAASEREAQHLADIKALRGFVDKANALDWYRYDAAKLLTATAHYDDAKAVCVVDGCEKPRETAFRCCDHVIDGDIGVAWSDDAKADAAAEDWQAWANGSCPEPGCSLVNPHEQGVACVKPTAAEGGEG